MFVTWLRRFFEVDEARLRMRLYLHEGLDLEAAIAFWSELTAIPSIQFRKPYRAVADPTIRRTKHVMGCPAVVYGCTAAASPCHGADRGGIVDVCPSGVAQLAERRTVNQYVVGSSPTPGARRTQPRAVAQWSEQGTHNPWVVGSIPTRPTI